MFKANVFEVKAKLSEYLDRAASGERIVICRHNKPVAELRAIQDVRIEPRPIGPLPGRPTFTVPPSFFEPLADEELELWEQGGAADPLSYVPTEKTGGRASKVAEAKAGYHRGRARGAARRRR
ncbi:MAG: type II toxin-antitoxin system Phd/YefM family antitoxin [Vicinamibacterales bacterium]